MGGRPCLIPNVLYVSSEDKTACIYYGRPIIYTSLFKIRHYVLSSSFPVKPELGACGQVTHRHDVTDEDVVTDSVEVAVEAADAGKGRGDLETAVGEEVVGL